MRERGESVHLGHLNIEQHDVDRDLAQRVECQPSVWRGRSDDQVGSRLDDLPEGAADDRAVVDQ